MIEVISQSWSDGWFSTVYRRDDGTTSCVSMRMVSPEPYYWGA